jgi:hypothetical protein
MSEEKEMTLAEAKEYLGVIKEALRSMPVGMRFIFWLSVFMAGVSFYFREIRK